MNLKTIDQEVPGKPSGSSAYDPGLLLDQLQTRMNLAGDAQLARRLNIDRHLLGKIRARQVSITGSILMTMQEASGIPVAELKRMLNDGRKTSRMESSFVQSGLKGGSDCRKRAA